MITASSSPRLNRHDFFMDSSAATALRSASRYRHCWHIAVIDRCPHRYRRYLLARMREEALEAVRAARFNARLRAA